MSEIDKKLKDLSQLRRDIELEKNELQEKKGRRKGLIERLTKEFGVDGKDGAIRECRNLDNKITVKNTRIDEKLIVLKEKYDFG